MAKTSPVEEAPHQDPISIYRIDLSLPPSERYTQLATEFAPKMREIIPLFDEVLAVAIPWAWARRVLEWLSTFFLRRLYSSEETQELKGIAMASGVDLYFLVALNVLLDSLMGCTSGGVLTKPEKSKYIGRSPWIEDERAPRMMHFRTLDWGMDELRSVLVILEFVRSKSETPEKVIARTITYAGFVGVLTGVRYVVFPFGRHVLTVSEQICLFLLMSDPPIAAQHSSFAFTRCLCFWVFVLLSSQFYAIC